MPHGAQAARDNKACVNGSGPIGAPCYSVLTQWNERAVEKVIKSVDPTRDAKALAEDLCRALLTPRDGEEMARLLADLCTPAEVRTLAERWHVARLLESTDLSYRDIHDATGVSTTTIVRVARFLRQEPYQAYRKAMQRLGENDDD